MAVKTKGQIQIRIDSKTKREAKKVLEGLGMDMSSAVKIFLRQVVNTNSFPCELRDENGFTRKGAESLREAIYEAEHNKKTFNSVDALMKDLLKD